MPLFCFCLLLLYFSLLLPFRKLPLPFLALIEGQNVRQDAAGYRLDLVLGNGGVVNELFSSSQMYLRVSKDLPLAVFAPPLALLLFFERLPDFRGYALDKPPELFVFLFQHEDFHLFLYALFAVDLLFQALVLLRQIVDGGLILLHLPQVPFQPGEVRPHHLQNLVPLLPGVQHPNFRHRLFYGLLLAGQVYGLLEQPCGDVLALCDKGALAPLKDGERLFHVGVKLVLPLGELRPVAQNLLCRQPPVLRDGGEAQVEVGRFLVHVYHGGEDVPPAHLLLHKSYRFGEVGLYFFLASACEELRAGST